MSIISSLIQELVPIPKGQENYQICSLYQKFDIINQPTPTLAGVGAPGPRIWGPFLKKDKVRIRIYVDFLNYLNGAPKKYEIFWVDLEKLFLTLVKEKIPNAEIERITIFNAMLSGTPAKYQDLYLNASVKHSDKLFIDNGYHKKVSKIGKVDEPGSLWHKLKFSFNTQEEKQTDGNIIAQMVHEAHTESDMFDIAVLVSNDTDLARALKIKQELNQRVILISPTAISTRDNPIKIPTALGRYVPPEDRILGITKKNLLENLLPDKIYNYKKPGVKSWFIKDSESSRELNNIKIFEENFKKYKNKYMNFCKKTK